MDFSPLDLLIPPAYAQGGGGGAGLIEFLPLIIIFVIFYFLLIRPQQKRAKEHKSMVEAGSRRAWRRPGWQGPRRRGWAARAARRRGRSPR